MEDIYYFIENETTTLIFSYLIKKIIIKLKMNSKKYWEERYAKKGNSGKGSYNKYALFKSEVISDFISMYFISSVLELGCGDGNQLDLFKGYNQYIGTDVSSTIIKKCKEKYKGDPFKKFYVHSKNRVDKIGKVNLKMSLDVLYHLIEDEVFDEYMECLTSNTDYVIIYSSNKIVPNTAKHVKHRVFTDHYTLKDFELIKMIPNKYPYKNSKEGTHADFYSFKKI